MATKSGWVVEFVNKATRKEFLQQPESIQAKFMRIRRKIENEGFDEISPKYKEKIRDGLWEMRLTGKNVIARGLYLKREVRRVIIVRVFTKKTQKIERHHIDIALKRAKEYDNAQ